MIITSSEKYGFVFEDDAMPCFDNIRNPLFHLASLSNKLDIVSLVNQRPKLKKERIISCSDDTSLCALRGNDFGAIAYFITADAAQKLLNHPQRFEYEVDLLIHHWWMHECQILHLVPSLFIEDGRASSIGYSDIPRWQNDTWFHKIFRRINRLYESVQKRLFFAKYLKMVRKRFD